MARGTPTLQKHTNDEPVVLIFDRVPESPRGVRLVGEFPSEVFWVPTEAELNTQDTRCVCPSLMPPGINLCPSLMPPGINLDLCPPA